MRNRNLLHVHPLFASLWSYWILKLCDFQSMSHCVLMKDLFMKPPFLFRSQIPMVPPPCFLFCANFHCTVEGCISHCSVLTLCKSTVFLYCFYFSFAPFLWLPITIKYKKAFVSCLFYFYLAPYFITITIYWDKKNIVCKKKTPSCMFYVRIEWHLVT